MLKKPVWVSLFVGLTVAISTFNGHSLSASEPQWRDYLARRTVTLRDACLKQKPAQQTWPEYQTQLRRELYSMLGLWPLPEKTDLKPVITGTLEREGVIVEKIHFQSRPGLYVTANLYRPRTQDKPLPAVVYVCGHGEVKRNGVAYGNKTHYQHHGAWLAQNGYVCLTIDTVQLGEIEGIHHGTYRFDMWWWINRGYTPAGVEAWNAIRAVDYLVTRPEVDAERLAVTGRSGGGAYSWWLAALDERIDCAIPVAGITDLQNHVIDNCVEGHCDCMFFVNQYGWDYPAVAALIAPRPLLISNTDRDPIFPLEGVNRVHSRVRDVYKEMGKAPLLGLNITAGEHVDTQELQVHALRWLNAHLKNENDPIPNAATKLFEIEELKVFKELPPDQRNSTVQEWFVVENRPILPPLEVKLRAAWKNANYDSLRNSAFRCWPAEPSEAILKIQSLATPRLANEAIEVNSGTLTIDPSFPLPIYVLHRPDVKTVRETHLVIVDPTEYDMAAEWLQNIGDNATAVENRPALAETSLIAKVTKKLNSESAVVLFLPRGVGPTAWPGDKKSVTQFHRRLYLLGETLDSLQTYDIATAISTLPSYPLLSETKIIGYANGTMATNLLYAAGVSDVPVELEIPPVSDDFRNGPYYLNISRQ